MPQPDTHDIDSLTGATYFVVGRGTEGGPSSYHLSIAGITSGTTDPHWGDASHIVANSGYSLGTIQVDLGQRGTWALGATDGAALKPGETSYVDGIIGQASQYASDHHLPFTTDTAQLRTDLLSHGNGERGRTTLTFIDKDTRDSIDAWASSDQGKQWIHRNIDYPQIRNATQSALDMLDTYGRNIPEEHRLETIAILAKTENQIPSQMKKFEQVLKDGGNYDDVLAKADQIKHTYAYYDGPKAAAIAAQYTAAFADPDKAAALERAQNKVGAVDFSPAASANDPDMTVALATIGQGGRSHAGSPHVLREGAHGAQVIALQDDLLKLGVTDAQGRSLRPDGDYGPGTRAAVENFQRTHGLAVDGVAGAKTLDAIHTAVAPVRHDAQAHAGDMLREGAHGTQVTALQNDLARLGITDARGHVVRPDGDFGSNTRAAVERFQRAQGLTPDGVAGPKTLDALHKAVQPAQATLDDPTHPGNDLYTQALRWVHALDAERGRVADRLSRNFAGSLATSSAEQGLSRIDHVVLSDDGKRAFAVQGELKSPLRRIADVDVTQSVQKPLEQSSSEFHQLAQRQPSQPTTAILAQRPLQVDPPAQNMPH